MDCGIIDDETDSQPHKQNVSEPIEKGPVSLASIEDFLNFQRGLTNIRLKVYSDLNQMGHCISQEYSNIIELFDEVLANRHIMLTEAIQKSFRMEEILKRAEEVPSSKQAELLDCMNACFSSGPWIKKSINSKILVDIKKMLKNYIRVDYGEQSKLENIVGQFLKNSKSMPEDNMNSLSSDDSCLVAVTNVIDPGEFYVIRWCKREKYQLISSTLEAEAYSYPKPSEIVEGKMYAVCSSNRWYRGVCGQQCGIYQMGDGPSQNVYSFFFVDEGHNQTIPSSLIRCLSEELEKIPKLALQCTLNPDFKPAHHNMEIVNRFKQATYRSPMLMKTLSQESGKLNVDLAHIPCFGEDTCIPSLRDTLFPVTKVEEEKKPFRKYKTKFDIGAESYVQPEALRVFVSHVQNPFNIYVNVIDEERKQFEQMHSKLQAELVNAQPVFPQNLCKGHVCSAKYENEWYRVLVEEVTHNGQVEIFYVDTGHRQTIFKECCFHLPDKFLELPAQSLRCVLDGLKPWEESNRSKSHNRPKWSRAAVSNVKRVMGKMGLINVEHVSGRLVGKLDLSTELTVFCILYIDGETFSLNHHLCAQGHATCRKRTVAPNIDRLRQELAPETSEIERKLPGDGNLDSKPCEAVEQAAGARSTSPEYEKKCYVSSIKSSPEDVSQSVEDPSTGELSHQHGSESSTTQASNSSVEISSNSCPEQGGSNISTLDSSSQIDSGIFETSVDDAGLEVTPKPDAQLPEPFNSPKSLDTANPSVFRTEIRKLRMANTKKDEPLDTIEPSSLEQLEGIPFPEENTFTPDSKSSSGKEISDNKSFAKIDF